MNSVWDAVVYSVRGVVHQLQADVDYVAITAQGDGCWLVDHRGAPPGPVILWNDGRAAEVVERWTRAGVLDRAFRINGSLTSSGLPNAILTWLREYDPDRLESSAASLTCGGWIFAPDDRTPVHRRVRRGGAVHGHPLPPLLPRAAPALR